MSFYLYVFSTHLIIFENWNFQSDSCGWYIPTHRSFDVFGLTSHKMRNIWQNMQLYAIISKLHVNEIIIIINHKSPAVLMTLKCIWIFLSMALFLLLSSNTKFSCYVCVNRSLWWLRYFGNPLHLFFALVSLTVCTLFFVFLLLLCILCFLAWNITCVPLCENNTEGVSAFARYVSHNIIIRSSQLALFFVFFTLRSMLHA